MKQTLILLCIFVGTAFLFSQETAHRFLYQFYFKSSNNYSKIDSCYMSLDILPNKSIYRDYLSVSQDSIVKNEFEKMQTSGAYKDLSKVVKNPRFTYKIEKNNLTKSIQYTDDILNGINPIKIGYNELVDMKWKIQKEKSKIENYSVQKATVTYGGRNWIAWFCNELPFSDGPYKFWGLPGLIVKLEDTEKSFVWLLKANKKIESYSEQTFLEKTFNVGAPKIVSKEKFIETFKNFKDNPLNSMKSQFTAEQLKKTVPGTDVTLDTFLKKQSEQIKELYNKNSLNIELN